MKCSPSMGRHRWCGRCAEPSGRQRSRRLPCRPVSPASAGKRRSACRTAGGSLRSRSQWQGNRGRRPVPRTGCRFAWARQDSGPLSPKAPGRRASAPSCTPSSTISAVDDARSDSLAGTSRAANPGELVGTTNPRTTPLPACASPLPACASAAPACASPLPACASPFPACASATFAQITATSAMVPFVIHIFAPSSR